jgi:hypothetical protein
MPCGLETFTRTPTPGRGHHAMVWQLLTDGEAHGEGGVADLNYHEGLEVEGLVAARASSTAATVGARTPCSQPSIPTRDGVGGEYERGDYSVFEVCRPSLTGAFDVAWVVQVWLGRRRRRIPQAR